MDAVVKVANVKLETSYIYNNCLMGGYKQIMFDIPEFNEKAYKMFELLGFSHEGTFRKSRPHKGVRHNSFIMGMILEEYNEKFSDIDIKSHVIEWDNSF